jgi:putative tryptophan/tyrosine transport system substrate-binding protein
MKRRELIALLGGVPAYWAFLAFAQVSARRPIVAVLVGASSANARKVLNGFSEGMQELGYVEGRDVDIVYRYANGDLAALPALANELAQLKPGYS